MSSPEPTPDDDDQQGDSAGTQVPPANPAYSTPPPKGVPSADDSSSA